MNLSFDPNEEKVLPKKQLKKVTEEALHTKNPLNEMVANYAKKKLELKLQATLDYQKWLESEQAKYDKSGSMPYCNACCFCENGKCKARDKERSEFAYCAHAVDKLLIAHKEN